MIFFALFMYLAILLHDIDISLAKVSCRYFLVKENIQFFIRTVPDLRESEVGPDKQYNASASPNKSINDESVGSSPN